MDQSEHRRKVWTTWLGRFALLGVLLIGQEMLLRAVFPVPELPDLNRVDYSDVRVTPEMARKLTVANRSLRWVSDPDHAESVQKLNLYGFRDVTWTLEKDQARRRVAIVGDSFIEGFMLTEAQTIPRQFERQERLENNTSLEVMNLGVATADVSDYLRLIRDTTPHFLPDDLLLVLFANDFPVPTYEPSWLESVPAQATSERYLPRALHIILNLLDGRPVVRCFEGEPISFLAAAPNRLNPWSNPSFVERFAPFVTESIQTAMKQGRFNPYIVNEDIWYRSHLRHPCDMSAHLRALRHFLNRLDCRLFVAYLPSRGQVSNAYAVFLSEYSITRNVPSVLGKEYQIHAAMLKRVCSILELPFLDLTKTLREAERTGVRMYWNYDGHLRKEGASLVARRLRKWWRAQPR